MSLPSLLSPPFPLALPSSIPSPYHHLTILTIVAFLTAFIFFIAVTFLIFVTFLIVVIFLIVVTFLSVVTFLTSLTVFTFIYLLTLLTFLTFFTLLNFTALILSQCLCFPHTIAVVIKGSDPRLPTYIDTVLPRPSAPAPPVKPSVVKSLKQEKKPAAIFQPLPWHLRRSSQLLCATYTDSY